MQTIPCEAVVTQLRLYFAGALSAQEEYAMDQHLDQCEACTAKLNALLESEAALQLSPQIQKQLLRWLRSSYTVHPAREREGIATVMAVLQSSESRSTSIAWAAADVSAKEEIRHRIGAIFEQHGLIPIPPYTGALYVRDQHSAFLEFRKGGQLATELHGKTIEFSVGETLHDAAASSVSQTIADGIVVINFAQLGIPIEEFGKVGLKLYIDASTVIEGHLGHA